MIRQLLALFLGLCVCAPAWSADPANKSDAANPPTTASFAQAAVVGNLFEVESSKLALERAQSPAVKTFAQHMVDDHSKAAVELTDAIGKTNVAQPPMRLDARHLTILDGLRGKHGADFERAYVEAQYAAHVDAVEQFKGYAAAGENADLRAVARELLPTLQKHLDEVTKLKDAKKK